LVSISEGEFTQSTIGTITLSKFIALVRKHLRVSTPTGLINEMSKYAKFPRSNIQEITPKTIVTFRNLVKQYSNNFMMLLDIFTYNKDIIIPVNDVKKVGLIWKFNIEVPFGFAEGIYRNIGRHKDGKKKQFNTMQEYINEFEKEIDTYYKKAEKLQPMFDAVTEPDKKPRPLQVSSNNQKARVKVIDEDGNSISDMTTSDSLSQGINAIADRRKPDIKDQACFKQAIYGDCTREDCKYSHEQKVLEEYREFLKNKLT
jgi:hypothetical protein